MFLAKVLAAELRKAKENKSIEKVIGNSNFYDENLNEFLVIGNFYKIISEQKLEFKSHGEAEFLAKIKALFTILGKDLINDFLDPLEYFYTDLFSDGMEESAKDLLLDIEKDLKLAFFLSYFYKSLTNTERDAFDKHLPFCRYINTLSIVASISKKLNLSEFENLIPQAIAAAKNIIKFSNKRSMIEDIIVNAVADYLKQEHVLFSEMNLALSILGDKKSVGFKKFEKHFDEVAEELGSQNDYTSFHFNEFMKNLKGLE